MNIKHFIRKHYLKLTRGYDCCEAVSANYWIAETIEPIIRHMSEHAYSIPGNLTHEKWKKILTDMADGFKAYVEADRTYTIEEEAKLYKKTKKGLKLFEEYFFHLWI